MNKALLLLSIICITSLNSFSQPMKSFFYDEGVPILTTLAHPFNTVTRSNYSVNEDYVLVNIYYENTTTKLKVLRDGDTFYDIKVIYDDDIIGPFSGIKIFKNILIYAIVKRPLGPFIGRDFVPKYLTSSWKSYKHNLEKIKREQERIAALQRQREIRDSINKLRNEYYRYFINTGDKHFSSKQYEKAKIYFEKSLEIKPDEYYPKRKIREIEDIQALLKERNWKYSDYNSFDSYHYRSLKSSLEERVEAAVRNGVLTGSASGELIFTIDTLGITTHQYQPYRTSNPQFKNFIYKIGGEYSLKQPYQLGYTVMAKATIPISMDVSEKTIRVKKRNNQTEILDKVSLSDRNAINSLISSGPMGNYRIYLLRGSINGSTFLEKRIEKYRGIGGPQNALLSVAVPGWGVSKVTGGKSNGAAVTVWSYLLVGSAVLCKVGSDNNYKKYHQARDQESIDDYYDKANNLNKAAYWVGGIGAGLWVSNFIWVTGKGFKNLSEQRKFKHSISMGTIPSESKSVYALSYKFNF